MNNKTLISISIPVLNEEGNLDALYSRLSSLAVKMSDRCDMEFVFSDNHSEDNTWHILKKMAANDQRIRAIRFSKNYGFQRSIFANYLHTRGEAVMQIDADLQDPPEMLETFFAQWQKGYHVVYGIRRKRPESFFMNAFRRIGYWIINKVSEHPIPQDVGDFRLVDRKVIQSLSHRKVVNPYLRGMIADMGFNQTGILYDRDARMAGVSKFNVYRLVVLGLTATFNHSTVPLRMASFLGAMILVASLCGAVYYLFLRILHPELPRGFTSIAILLTFSIGLNAFFLGIIGEYLLRIYQILRAEPVAIVEESLNLQPSELKL
jgi:glycosyltransferase involved in cell wall biosynthesis